LVLDPRRWITGGVFRGFCLIALGIPRGIYLFSYEVRVLPLHLLDGTRHFRVAFLFFLLLYQQVIGMFFSPRKLIMRFTISSFLFFLVNIVMFAGMVFSFPSFSSSIFYPRLVLLFIAKYLEFSP